MSCCIPKVSVLCCESNDFVRNMSTTSSPKTPNDYFIAGAILFPIVVVIVIANIMMFAAVLDLILSKKLQGSVIGPVLVLNLAVSDTVLGITGMMAVTDFLHSGSHVACYLSVGIVGTATLSSSLIMMCIAIDRFITVRNPFRDRSHDKLKLAGVVTLIWILSTLISFLPMMGWRDLNAYQPGDLCVFLNVVPDSYILFLVFGIFLPIMTLTAYLYISMCKASRDQGRKIAACTVLGKRSSINNNTNSSELDLKDKPMIRSRTYSVFSVSRQNFHIRTMSTGDVCMIRSEVELPGINVIKASSAPQFEHLHDSAALHRTKFLDHIKPKKSSRTVILIVGLFISMWIPFWLTSAAQALCGDACHVEDLVSTYLLVLGISNAAVNPLVYISTDRRLKTHFCQCFFRSPDPDVEDSSDTASNSSSSV